MTLVITVLSDQGLWQSTDHQLAQVEGQPITDRSLKSDFLEAEDGKAMIGYAGIGRVGKMHIAEWVRAVLRGKRCKLNDHLAILLKAADRRLMPISKRFGIPHTFSIAAFQNGRPVLYVITNRLKEGKPIIRDNFVLITITLAETQARVLITFEGQGAMAIKKADQDLIAKTIQRRAANPSLGDNVGAILAHLNDKASQDKRSEGLVSQSCTVTYLKSPKDGLVTRFHGWDPAVMLPMTHHIAGGYDVTNIVESLMPFFMETNKRNLERLRKGESLDDEVDIDFVNDLLRRGHKEPSDEFE